MKVLKIGRLLEQHQTHCRNKSKVKAEFEKCVQWIKLNEK